MTVRFLLDQGSLFAKFNREFINKGSLPASFAWITAPLPMARTEQYDCCSDGYERAGCQRCCKLPPRSFVEPSILLDDQ